MGDNVKVLLRENIEKLGKRGDIVNVKAGFARNYLMPRQLAWAATKENLQRLEAEKRQYNLRQAKLKEERQEIAEKLKKTTLTLIVQATPEGQLYGSIQARQLVDAFKQQNIELPGDSILLEQPIKEIGVHKVKIRVHPEIPEVEVTIKVQGPQG